MAEIASPGGISFPSFDDRVPFLVRLEDAERKALLTLGRKVNYKARTEVIHQFDPSTHVLLVLKGRLMVTAVAAKGYVVLLALRRPGDLVGESAALSGGPRSATVTTLENAECVLVGRETFLEFLAQYPNAHHQLSGLLVDRVRAGDRRALQFASLSVKERLAVLLLDLARSHSRRTDSGLLLTVPLSQQELAGSVGASREAIARLLTELRKNGVVVTARRKILVLRPEVLRRIAAGGEQI
ncbi:Crp/Fnr family transcriptional regulator [Streptomyces sp. NBC_01803]|uniref:Crp/Fnr family transcriptional regulator n=1 Tax=Streptomyces sp. NBC_01803 TaxID=2975946 RepID=UPI002DDBD1FA|nr:Crp/Fnr family transcriptional regulator [Streptomyces sp. NBC_01803]WSA45532.1 Crp/Fnr family transcriptional regulator [Streptomyces sp. NBC_01803]